MLISTLSAKACGVASLRRFPCWLPQLVGVGVLLMCGTTSAAKYQCDNFVVTETPSEYSGCVNIESGEPYREASGEQAQRFSGMDRFASVQGMLNALGDFRQSSGKSVVEEDQPPHIHLRPLFSRGDTYDVKTGIVQRALLYGVYRTFAHTPVDKVTVDVIPQKRSNHRLQHDYRERAAVSRSLALAVVQRYVDVDALADLVTARKVAGQEVRNQWIRSFEEIYYESPPRSTMKRVIDALQD